MTLYLSDLLYSMNIKPSYSHFINFDLFDLLGFFRMDSYASYATSLNGLSDDL